MIKRPPTPRGSRLLGNLRELQKDPLQAFMCGYHECGDIFCFRTGPYYTYFLSHPNFIKHFLKDHAKNYSNHNRTYKYLRMVFGNGLIMSEGNIWQEQRAKAQIEMSSDRVVKMVPEMTSAIEDVFNKWEPGNSRNFDVYQEMAFLALNVADRVLLGVGLEGDIKEIIRLMRFLSHNTVKKSLSICNIPLFIPIPGNLRYQRALNDIKMVIMKMVNVSKEGGLRNSAIFSMVLSDKNEEEICNEILTLLWTAYETTALLLSWTWMLLSQHPDVEIKLRDEISTVLEQRVPCYEDLGKLKYANCVIKESLRLYPPAWQISRVAIEKDNIGGYDIPAHSVVYTSPYVVHRHKDYWADPEYFQPERFAQNNIQNIPPFAYIPFGAGPRSCVGYHFSLTEVQLVIVMLLQRYSLRLESTSVKMNPEFVLYPQEPIYMTLQNR